MMSKPKAPPFTRRRFFASLAGLTASLLAGCTPRPAPTVAPTRTVDARSVQGQATEPPPLTRPVSHPPPTPTSAKPTATGAATLQQTEHSRPGSTSTAGASPAPPTATLQQTEHSRPARTEHSQDVSTKAKPIVAIGACNTYGPERVESVVRELVARCGGIGDIVRPGSIVVVKPNFTAGGRVPMGDGLPNILTYTTHPDVTRAIALLAREAGAKRILLVEGWGLDVWKINKYYDLIEELDAEPVNLDDPAPTSDFVQVPVVDHLELAYIWLHETIAKADVFISVPKIKCHASTGITLAIKNVFGCTPLPRYRERSRDSARTTMHKGNWGQRLPRILVDILRARPVDFCLVDGVSTIDQGEGPWNDNTEGIDIRTVHPHLLMAGRNAVAVDAVGTAVMGFDPTAGPHTAPFSSGLNHIALAAELGLGPNRLEEIEVRGLSIEQARFPFTPCPRLAFDSVGHMHLALRETGYALV